MPRSNLSPTEEQRAQVRKLAGIGLTHEHICAMMRISSPATLRRCFRRELTVGRRTAVIRIKAAEFKLASSGKNPAATIAWLKKAGWKPGMQVQDVSDRRTLYEPYIFNLNPARPPAWAKDGEEEYDPSEKMHPPGSDDPFAAPTAESEDNPLNAELDDGPRELEDPLAREAA